MDEERYKNFSIELDCPPGDPRPGDLIASVLKGTGLNVEDFDTSPPFFGEQVWLLKESADKDQLYISKRALIKKRVEKLYNDGVIRYGSW